MLREGSDLGCPRPRDSGLVCVAARLLGGCVVHVTNPEVAPTPVVVEARARSEGAAARAVSRRATSSSRRSQEVIGETQVMFARYEDTFSAIGRQYNFGYEELRAAPIPASISGCRAKATPIYLPTQSILPEAPREGIVVNVPAMRLYYFTTEKGDGARRVTGRRR